MKQIPPGGEGKITVTVATKGFGGEEINKSVEIQTDDPSQPKLTATMTGSVEKFAEITPEKVVLKGKANEPISAVVTIKPKSQYPFKILKITHAEKEEYIKYKLEETKEGGSLSYKLVIENIKKGAGRYLDNIIMETDSTVKPQISINVIGNISE